MISKIIIFALLVCTLTYSYEICPKSPNGGDPLVCGTKCCQSYEGPDHTYFCCEMGDSRVVFKDAIVRPVDGNSVDDDNTVSRPQRVIYSGTAFQIDYTLLLIGLAISIILSVLLSFLCCLLCNGCWLHRRRNPQQYEHVNESGWYPICCGFGIPMGTVVFSTHPPRFQEDQYYGTSTTSSLPRNRVRFNEDGTPKGVLKNGSSNDYIH